MDQQPPPKRKSIFPPWANYVVPGLLVLGAGALPYLTILIGFGLAPSTLNTLYAPEQPVAFSHALHAGELGMDCRYCHTTVTEADFAALPPTEICMNCHGRFKLPPPGPEGGKVGLGILAKSPEIQKLIYSYRTGEPIPWVKVHDLPDYVYFNHAIHVNKGVSCYECHGRVDEMEVITQVEPLNMGWCLDCHRSPAKHLRPKDQVFNMSWGIEMTEQERLELGKKLMEKYDIRSELVLSDCSICHR